MPSDLKTKPHGFQAGFSDVAPREKMQLPSTTLVSWKHTNKGDCLVTRTSKSPCGEMEDRKVIGTVLKKGRASKDRKVENKKENEKLQIGRATLVSSIIVNPKIKR